MKTLKQLEQDKLAIEKEINDLKQKNSPYKNITAKEFNQLKKEYTKLQNGISDKIRLKIELEVDIISCTDEYGDNLDDIRTYGENVKIVNAPNMKKDDKEFLEDCLENWVEDKEWQTNSQFRKDIDELRKKIKSLSKTWQISPKELEELVINYDSVSEIKLYES